MEDFIYLLTITPHDECCAQFGDIDYMNNARVEARAYINQLLRVYGENPPGTRFEIAQCPMIRRHTSTSNSSAMMKTSSK